MADTLADRLNAAAASDSGILAPPPPAPAGLNTSGWLGRTLDYLGNTDFGKLSEALARVSPATMLPYMAKDAINGTLVDNLRLQAGQLSRFPTDVVSGVVGAYPGIAAIRSLATGEPMSGFAQSLAGASDAIDEFGRKNWAEPIAGRSLAGDDAGSMLRGTAPEMLGNWSRVLSQAITPLPTKITAPIMAAANTFKTGIRAIDTATALAAKTVEGITPLAISSAPSAKTAALNMGIQGVAAPVSEAVMNALMPAKEAAAQQDQAQQMAQQSSAQVTAAKEAVTGPKPNLPVTPQTAGFITGDTPTDIGITALVAATALFGGYKTGAARRVTNGITKAITGYDPRLPEDATKQSLLTQVKQQWGSGAASLGKTMEETLRASGSYTEPQITDMVMRFMEEGASRTGASVGTRIRQFWTEGKFMDTPHRTISLNDLVLQHNALDEAQQKLFAQALWARQELDLRARQVNTAFRGTPSVIGSPSADTRVLAAEAAAGNTNKYSYNLFDTTTRDLHAIVGAAANDPAVSAVVRGYRDVLDKASSYMATEKRFTPAQVAEFKRDNPNYVPPKLDKTKNFLDPRDPASNFNRAQGIDIPPGLRTFEELGNPMEHLPRYMDEVFRSTEGMKTKRDFLMTLQHSASTGNHYAQSILGRDLGRTPAPESNHKFVTWRDLNGEKRITEVNDAVVRDALKGVTSPTMLQLQHGALSQFTRLYEAGAVGAPSLVAGTVFAPKSALYNITAGTILPRPEGISMGIFDKGLRTLTGGAMGIRGDVLGMTLDSLFRQAPANITAVLAERGARVLHNSVITNGFLARNVDPATLNSLSTSLQNWYKKSELYNMQSNALLGPGGFSAIDPSKMYLDPAAALKKTDLFGAAGGGFVSDILHAISVAPATSIMSMNKNMPDYKVNSAIRNLVGDPGRSGAFRNAPLMANAVNLTPWGNIYIQSMGKLASGFDSPKNIALTTMGIVNGIAIPAVMATMWNDSLGTDYVKHQFFNQTPDLQAGTIYLGIPGRPPSEGMNVQIDPVMRPFKYMSEALAGAVMGAFSGELFKPENADMQRMFSEMMTNRMGSFGKGTVPGALVDQVLKPPVPGIAQAGAAAMGVQLRAYGDARVPDARRHVGFAEGTRPGGDSVFDHVLPGLGEDIMRGLGSSVGGAVHNFFAGMQRDTGVGMSKKPEDFGNETKSVGDALGNRFKEFKQSVRDSTTELGSGPLFDNFRERVPSQDAASILVKDKLDTIKAITQQFNDTNARGAPNEMLGNRKIGRQERLGAHPAQPDLATGAMAQEIAELYKQLGPTLQQIKVEYTNMQGLQNSNLFGPIMKRALREQTGNTIVDLNKRMLQDIQRAETVLSNTYKRKVDFSNLTLP